MEVITSHTIKMDMNSSLEKLLLEVGIVQNSETRIKDYEDKITAYKAENERLIKKADDLKEFGFINTPTPKNKAIIDTEIEKVGKKIDKLPNLKLHCFGHIHDSSDANNAGVREKDGIFYSNAAAIKDNEFNKGIHFFGNTFLL